MHTIVCSELGTHKAIMERMQLWHTTAVPYDIKVSVITKPLTDWPISKVF